MANVKYTEIISIEYLKSRLLGDDAVPLYLLAKELHVPYNCLLSKVRLHFTVDEQKEVFSRKVRRKFSLNQKKHYALLAYQQGVKVISDKYEINPMQLRAWMRLAVSKQLQMVNQIVKGA